jgi:hypothetical protein
MAPRLVLAVGVVILASSCGRPLDEPASIRPSEPGPPAPSSTTVSPAGSPRELRFTEPRLGGGTVRGADFAGHDLVMWFWAPW